MDKLVEVFYDVDDFVLFLFLNGKTLLNDGTHKC